MQINRDCKVGTTTRACGDGAYNINRVLGSHGWFPSLIVMVVVGFGHDGVALLVFMVDC